MSNRIAKTVNWLPEIRSSGTITIVGVVTPELLQRQGGVRTAKQSC
jgi:hypothetical protein